jgi:hypothetical protein
VTPLPSKIGPADIAALQALTEQFRALGRSGHAGMPEVITPVSQRAGGIVAAAGGLGDDGWASGLSWSGSLVGAPRRLGMCARPRRCYGL